LTWGPILDFHTYLLGTFSERTFISSVPSCRNRSKVFMAAPPQLIRAESVFAKHQNATLGLTREDVKAALAEYMEPLGLEMTSDAHAELVNDRFDVADANNDGRLSKEEFHVFVSQLEALASTLGAAGCGGKTAQTPAVDLADPASLFSRFDVNSDARLDLGEAEVMLKQLLAECSLDTAWVTQEWLAQQFKLYDSDGDAQTLTEDEFRRFSETLSSWIAHLGTCYPPAAEAGATADDDDGDDEDD